MRTLADGNSSNEAILRALSKRPCSVMEICAEIGESRDVVKRRLDWLLRDGLVSKEVLNRSGGARWTLIGSTERARKLGYI